MHFTEPIAFFEKASAKSTTLPRLSCQRCRAHIALRSCPIALPSRGTSFSQRLRVPGLPATEANLSITLRAQVLMACSRHTIEPYEFATCMGRHTLPQRSCILHSRDSWFRLVPLRMLSNWRPTCPGSASVIQAAGSWKLLWTLVCRPYIQPKHLKVTEAPPDMKCATPPQAATE